MRTEEGGAERPPAWELTLPPEHPVSALRALWQGDGPPQPVRLDFRGGLPEETPLPAADPGQELKRIQFLISYAARARLEQAESGAPLETGTLVLLSSDQMIAWLMLFPPMQQGPVLAVPQLHRALVEHGVASGIDWAMLRRIPRMEQRYFIPFPVARGVLPRPGRDGSVIDKIPRVPESIPRPESLGKADYLALNLVRRIREGEIICEILQPGEGTPGCTVTGERLDAPPGAAARPPRGRNTCLTPDGRFLVAAREGHVVFSGRDFHVNAVLHLQDGELQPDSVIKFLGDVHIHGDLPGGASVSATGSVQVDGTVEGCSIEAGGHIVVSSGVQGQDQAVLYAHRQLYAKYLEHCTVYARQDVLADCIIDCHVYSNGSVQACTGRGVLIGGEVRAAREIRALTVGSKAERATRLVLGGLPCEETDRAQLQEELDRIAHETDAVEQQPAGAGREARLAKLRLNRCVAQAKLDKVCRELEMMPPPACDRAGNPVQVVCGAIYPGTVVVAGGDALTVETPRQDCVVGISGGRLGFS